MKLRSRSKGSTGRVQLVLSPWIRRRRPSSRTIVPVIDDNGIFLTFPASCGLLLHDRVDRNLLTLVFPKVWWLMRSTKLSVRVKLMWLWILVVWAWRSVLWSVGAGYCSNSIHSTSSTDTVHTFFSSQFFHLLSFPSFLSLTLKNLQSVPLPCLALGRDPHSLCIWWDLG